MARSNSRSRPEANWTRRAVALSLLNCLVIGLLITGFRQRRVNIADASMVPTPLPASPTSTPTPPPAPAPTADTCPTEAPVALYRAEEHHVYLEGAANPDDAAVFIEQLSAVIGTENITNNYVIDECVPAGADGVVRIEDGILFAYDSAEILPEFESALELVAVLIERFPVTVAVEGHTDDAGDDAYNLELSSARAEAAVSYLVAAGIDAERLSAQGFGEGAPIADNTTEQGRSQNRRIEFRLVRSDDATNGAQTGEGDS